ncbi:MAG: ATP-dependent DNA helicase RecQ [bacterium]
MNKMQQLLKTTFGFDQFRQGQKEVISKLIDGKSVLAVFPTGGGKSLCYQLPALYFNGLTLVISPLIALMKDQIDFLTSNGVKAARLDSSLDLKETNKVWEDIRNGNLKLLYIAPERFSNERFFESIKTKEISLLVIDEAHCISEWGHNFRPDYLKLAKIANDLKITRVLNLTATATPTVAKSIKTVFKINDEDYINTGFYRPNLELRITPCNKNERDNLLLKRLKDRPSGATIIYVTLQKTSEQVANYLQQNGFETRFYHAGMKPEDRNSVQNWFINSTKAIITATITFGMGIDKSDIRYVYHYNLPKCIESYVQEIGRAGRDGLKSICEMFACPDDVITLENFSYGDTPTIESIQSLVTELLSLGDEFAISIHKLSCKHDIGKNIISTLLAYLEISGIITSKSPFYNTYKFQPCKPSKEILKRFDQKKADFLHKLFSQAVKATTWFTIDIDKAALTLNVKRDIIISALNYLEEQGDLIINATELFHQYRKERTQYNIDILIQKLTEKFFNSEKRHIERIQQILNLSQSKDCLVSAILNYFGENFDKKCGHCNRCLEEIIPQIPTYNKYNIGIKEQKLLQTIATEKHPVLSTPRQLTRFLCGLSSPATSYNKPSLTKHNLFGSLSEVPFKEVLEFVERNI